MPCDQYFQLKNLSIITPRYFIHCLWSIHGGKIHRCLIAMHMSFFFFFFGDLIILLILIDNLTVNITPPFHFGQFSPEFIKYSRVLKSSAVTRLFVSSPKILKRNCSEQFGRFFMYNKNKRGPRVLPCGMPHSIVCRIQFHLKLDTL